MRYKVEPDSKLVLLLHQSDRDAFCELYIRYKNKLHSYCYRFLKSEVDADDIVQDIFIYIWESRDLINPNLSFSSFLYTITKNRILNYIRHVDIKAHVHRYLSQQDALLERQADDKLEFKELQQIFVNAIDQLPPKRKLIFNMSRSEHLSHMEIAERLGISVYTVQEHISESLKFIRKYAHAHIEASITLMIFLKYMM